MQVLTAALMGVFLLSGIGAAEASTTPSPVATTEPPSTTYTVSMTAYNAVPGQTDSDPTVTASGAYSDPNVVAARSQDLAAELPFGTIIAIESATSSPTCGYDAVGHLIGLRVIADAMNVKMHNKVDVLLPQKETTASGKSENPAVVLGLCKDVTIKVVGHVSISDMPTTQKELAADIDSQGSLAVAK